MKKIITILLITLFFSGCSLVTVEKPDTYVDKVPPLPKEQRMSLDGMEALSVGATEINKGLTELSTIVTLADDIETLRFVDILKQMLPRLIAMRDFSLMILGYVGVSGTDIDWKNPEKYFEQVKEEKLAMSKALSEHKEKALAFKIQVDEFKDKLTENEDLIKSERLSMNEERRGWKVVKNLSLGGLLGFFILVNVIAFLIQVFTKIPVLNAIWFGIFRIFKGTKQLVKGVQDVRDHFKKEAENGNEEAGKLLAIMDSKLKEQLDDSAKRLVSKIKKDSNLGSN